MQKNKFEKLDSYLPYEVPKLRKHGKVSISTQTVPIPIPISDGALPFGDIS